MTIPKIDSEEDDVAASTAKTPTISAAILGQFFEELEKDETLGSIPFKLRKVVLEEGLFDEPSIRAALFSDDP